MLTWLYHWLTRNDHLVVEAIAQHGPMGANKICSTLGWGYGRAYPALHRLERDEKIGSFWEDGPEPRKKYYYVKRTYYPN